MSQHDADVSDRAGKQTQQRKAEHLRLAAADRMQTHERYFDHYALPHRALPDVDFDAIDTGVTFLGKELQAPLLISCMTGGTDQARSVNRVLARAAEDTGIAVGVGSQRAALEQKEQTATFQIRDDAPTVPLLGNLGAVQLNEGYGLAECQAAVRMIDADALTFHLNPLQEAIQPEGDRNFAGLLPKMGAVAEQLDVPVIAKEIGCGLSGATAEQLVHHGITIIDVAGQGGTSWARIEAERADDLSLGDLFGNWGLPTPTAIREVRQVEGATVIGSGGLRSGLDIAKALALGAELAGMASPFLKAAMESEQAVRAKIEQTIRELKIAMFCAGARTIDELRQLPVTKRPQ